MNLGVVYRGRGLLAVAEASFLRALTLFETVEGTTREQASCHMNLGNVYQGRGLLAGAEASFLRALGLFESLGLIHEVRGVEFNVAFLREAQAAATSDAAQSAGLLWDGLRLAVGSMLDADARRFQFRTEGDRLAWAEHVAAPRIRLAFRLAARVKDADLERVKWCV